MVFSRAVELITIDKRIFIVSIATVLDTVIATCVIDTAVCLVRLGLVGTLGLLNLLARIRNSDALSEHLHLLIAVHLGSLFSFRNDKFFISTFKVSRRRRNT